MTWKATHIGTLCSPYYTGRSTSRIESSVSAVTFVGSTELAVDLGVQLTITTDEYPRQPV